MTITLEISVSTSDIDILRQASFLSGQETAVQSREEYLQSCAESLHMALGRNSTILVLGVVP